MLVNTFFLTQQAIFSVNPIMLRPINHTRKTIIRPYLKQHLRFLYNLYVYLNRAKNANDFLHRSRFIKPVECPQKSAAVKAHMTFLFIACDCEEITLRP